MNVPNRNYDREMEEALVKRASSSCVPRLLLHACCAPCSSAVLERLSPYFQITVLYYNPNIFPEEEYRHRVEELRRLVRESAYPNPVEVVDWDYCPERFFDCVKGLDLEPEGGRRCEACFRLRLSEAAVYAKRGNYDYVTTTLTISPQKDLNLLNRIGEEEAEKQSVRWLPSAFRKKGGYQRSIELSREHGLYRQDFCGCVFSKAERDRRNAYSGRSDMDIRKMLEGERSAAVIDLSMVRENLLVVKKDLPVEMKVIGVVKANSYGLGAVPVSKALRGLVWGYAVACVEEALELRHAGITEPILILSSVPKHFHADCIREDIRPTFFEAESLRAFGRTAETLRKTGLYQIAVDTGMTRIGVFTDEEGARTVREMYSVPHTRAEGIFTHLATMDESDASMAIRQMKRFKAFVEELAREGIRFDLVHAANSAAMIRSAGFKDEGIFNACRYGISLYGAYPSEIEELKTVPIRPVLSWYARVTRVAMVPAGTPVGYGATFVTEKPMRIGTVAVGYADGYPRSLSSKGDVLIRGKRARILGRVCMDQIMVDVSDIPDAKAGDLAVLMGRDGEEEITVTELSDRSGRFPYEFFSLIMPRVKRIYVE